jgi:hypothetical protein
MGCLFDRESAEESQLNDPALLCVELAQAIEGVIKGYQIHASPFGQRDCIVERDPGPSMPFRGLLPTRVLDQNLPHQLGAYRIKMRPIRKQHWLLLHKTKIGFVHESCALQCVAGVFFSKLVVRQAVELLVNKRYQLAQRLFVARPPSG